MKRWLVMGAILAFAGGILVQGISRAQVPGGPAPRQNPGSFDQGPGEQGATLRQPTFETPGTPGPPAPPVAAPAGLSNLWNNSGAARILGTPTVKRIAQLPSNQTNINKDIEVTSEAGPWLILVMTYSGENAPQQARKFAEVLRSTYKINAAYIFNYGADEKRKEYQRAEAEREKQRDALRKAGLDTTVQLPIRVRVSNIQEHSGVLIGGYRDRDEAFRVLEQTIRKLPPPDPKIVDLDMKYIGKEVSDLDPQAKSPQSKILVNKDSHAYINPFARAFPVRNPCVKQEEAPVNTAADLAFLRKINANETFSLFQCKKPYTLAIKQFKTMMVMQENPNEAKGFLDRLVQKNVDYAAQNAHNVAEGFRKAGLPETYVLHARFCSYVTVGGFDGPDDPSLLGMQNFLEGRFKMEAFQPLELFPRPAPMQVPH